MKKLYKNGAGFTLIELLVVTAIIVILSAIILPSYRVGEKEFALQRSVHKLAQDLRRAEELSMSAEHYDCPPGWKMKGYGINLVALNSYYSLKARCEKEGNPYNDISVGDRISLEMGVQILTTTSQNIFFYPPQPEIDLEGANEVEITLCLKIDETKKEIIKVNKAGLINVEPR